jgi:hypothetical protein
MIFCEHPSLKTNELAEEFRKSWAKHYGGNENGTFPEGGINCVRDAE